MMPPEYTGIALRLRHGSARTATCRPARISSTLISRVTLYCPSGRSRVETEIM
jgi:hypothetical protein